MDRIGHGPRITATLAALVLAAGCGSPVKSPAESLVAEASGHPTGTPTATVPAEAWDLVWFSDSSVAAAADGYAARIQERLGVTVRLHNFWGPGDRGSAVFIADMTEVAVVEEAIQDAEVIVLYANPARTVAGDALSASCIWDIQKGDPPKTYAAGDFKEFADKLRSIYERIAELRNGRTAVIRAVDAYVGLLPEWKAAGIERRCTAGWEAWTSVSRSVAGAYGVPMASMYDAMNGPKHDEDPKVKGLIGPDGAHPGEAGTALQVGVLDALGYETVDR